MTKTIKIGVTGHKGVIGREFIKKFQGKSEFYKFSGDITNKKDVEDWVKILKENNVNKILHLAAKVKLNKNQKENLFKITNKNGTYNLLYFVNKYYKKPPWLFIASTCQVYKSKKKKLKESDAFEPLNPYSKSKIDQEKIVKKFDKLINYICIGRIFSYTSALQNQKFFIPSLYKKFIDNKNVIKIYGSNKIRDFLYSTDVIKIIYTLLLKNTRGTINIGSGNPVTIKNISIYMKKKLKKKSQLIFLDENKEISYVSNNSKLRRQIKLNRSYKSVVNKYVKYVS